MVSYGIKWYQMVSNGLMAHKKYDIYMVPINDRLNELMAHKKYDQFVSLKNE